MAENLQPDILTKDSLKPIVIDSLAHMARETRRLKFFTNRLGRWVPQENARLVLLETNDWDLAIAEIFLRRDYQEQDYNNFLLKQPLETIQSDYFQTMFSESKSVAQVKFTKILCSLISQIFTEEKIESTRTGLYQKPQIILTEEQLNDLKIKKAELEEYFEIPADPEKQLKALKELGPRVFRTWKK